MHLRRTLSLATIFCCIFAALASAQVTEEDDLMNGAPVKPMTAPAAPLKAQPPIASDDLTAPDPDIAGTSKLPETMTPPAPEAAKPSATTSAQDPAASSAAVPPAPDPDAAYDAAFAKLTPKQKATLEDLDKKFLETLRPLVQVFKVGAGLEFCLSEGHPLMGEDSRYIPAFKLFKEEQDETQAALWDAHHAEVEKANFMPAGVLEAHFQSQADIALEAAQQMVEEGGKTGAFNKTDCTQIQQILGNAVAKARATYPKAPETPKKAAGQGTSPPPKR